MNMPIWFERAIHPELVEDIGEEIAILGPGTEVDPYAGIDEALGVLASVLDYDGEVMDRAHRLIVIARTGIGYDAVDVEAATARGVAVCNTPDAPTVSTAEHAVGLLLAVAKGFVSSIEMLRSGLPDLYSRHHAVELEGKTLGLVGFGRIARRVARAAEGLGMHVMAYDPFASDEGFFVDRTPTLEGLLESADFVSIHVPLTADTRQMFDGTIIGAMRPGSVLINTSRGDVVDHHALLEAIDSGHLFGAGLDVTQPEPLPPAHPLLHRPNVVVTPHVASGTIEGRVRIFRAALGQVKSLLAGRLPEHLVNPEVWGRLRKVGP